MTFLATAWGFLKGIPKEVYYLAAAALVVWLYGNARYDAGYEKRTAEYAEVARKAAQQARKADGVAREAVEETKATVAAENDRAREVAKDSDDPLRDAFRELR